MTDREEGVKEAGKKGQLGENDINEMQDKTSAFV